MFSLSESVATSCSAVGSGFGRRRLAAQRRTLVAPAISDPPETGGKRGVRKAQCAEAGSVSTFTLHENFECTPLTCSTARNSQDSLACDTDVHDAMQRVIRSGRNLGNSFNSEGDTEAWRCGFCEPGEQSHQVRVLGAVCGVLLWEI